MQHTRLRSWLTEIGLRNAALVAAALVAPACASADLGVADTGAVDAAVLAEVDGSVAPDASQALDASDTDSGTTPTADAGAADGCVPDWTNLLSNGSFESGRSVWTEDLGGGTQAIIRQQGGGLPFAPHAGSWAALMLGYNNAALILTQTVTVPAQATALRVSGYKCWVTDEVSGTGDQMSIELRAVAGTLVQSLAAVSNADAGAVCSWTPFEYAAADSHAGQTLSLVISATSNGANATSFALDTLTVDALMCP